MSAGSLLRLAAIAHICLLRSPELIAFYVPGRPALPTKERVPILNSVAASLAPVWRPAMRIIAQALWLSGCVEQGTDHSQILRSAGSLASHAFVMALWNRNIMLRSHCSG